MEQTVLSCSGIQCAPQQVFLQSVFLALRLSPSQDNRPVCLSLLQGGCTKMGLPELFCLCPDPGAGARVLQEAKLQSLKMSCLAGFVFF